jgi:hypothetical protein
MVWNDNGPGAAVFSGAQYISGSISGFRPTMLY